MTDDTAHTNVTDDMSVTSSVHDSDYPNGAPCHQTCAICLDEFVCGKDKVSWSRFQTCHHAYHRKCIEGWLLETKNEDGSCPCCRGPYLKEIVQADANETGGYDEEMAQGTVNDARAHVESSVNADPAADEDQNAANGDNDCFIQPSILDDDTPGNEATKKAMGPEFTSFCIVHGLMREKQNVSSIKLIEEPAEMENV